MSIHGDSSVGRSGGGAARLAVVWVQRWWRALLAELVGTALLVGLGAASLLSAEGAPPPPLAQPALAFGFLVVALVAALGSASGAHLNPAVTLTALLRRQLGPATVVAYALVQTVGAVVGYAVLGALVEAARRPGAGVTLPVEPVSPAAAALLEALLTAPLCMLCCAGWAHAAPDPAAPIKAGLTVAGLIFVGGPLTGASLNPARSFGPALYHGVWQHHWVYWVGPLGGALLAAALHTALSVAPRAPSPAATEMHPLRDKLDP